MLHGPDQTIGEFVDAVLAVEDEQKARTFYACAVVGARWAQYHAHWAQIQGGRGGAKSPEEVVRLNIGWVFGEGMSEERKQMWVRVCDAAHPVFGTKTPTPEEALAAGFALAERARDRAREHFGEEEEER